MTCASKQFKAFYHNKIKKMERKFWALIARLRMAYALKKIKVFYHNEMTE